MKVLVCDPVSPKGVAVLQQRADFEVQVLDQRLPEAELIRAVAEVAALVGVLVYLQAKVAPFTSMVVTGN